MMSRVLWFYIVNINLRNRSPVLEELKKRVAGHEHEFLLDIVGGQTFVLPALAGTFSQGVQTVVSGGVDGLG